MATQFPPNEKPAAEEELMTFPCDFGLKVFGYNGAEFEGIVLNIVRGFCDPSTEFKVTRNESKKGKYQSLTIHFMAQSRAQLDSIYQALTDSEHVVMSL